jgi:mannose-6-phosphate isomerase-like protein (cupin superfamily)
MEKELHDNLKRLKELTSQLVSLPRISHIDGNKASYDMVSGECTGIGLINNGSVAAQYAEMSEGAEMECHIHEGMKEIIICFEGDISVTANEPTSVLAQTIIYTGGIIVIDPFVPHLVKSMGGCKLIAITIPASQGYPEAKNLNNG